MGSWWVWAVPFAALFAVVGLGHASKESRRAGTSVLGAVGLLSHVALLHVELRGEMTDPTEAGPLVVRGLGESLGPVVAAGAAMVLFFVLTLRARDRREEVAATEPRPLERRLSELSAVAMGSSAVGVAIFFRDVLFKTAVLEQRSSGALPWAIGNAAAAAAAFAMLAGLASLALGRSRRG